MNGHAAVPPIEGVANLEVIDFPVLGDDDGFVLVIKRLLSALKVNDRQASMAQSNAGFKMKAIPVRPPMRDCCIHRLQQVAINCASSSDIDNAGYATHTQYLSIAIAFWYKAR